MAFSGDWDEGIASGNFHNRGTKKRKIVGKKAPHPRGIKKGIRAKRMAKRA
jgi:hypothetical protein